MRERNVHTVTGAFGNLGGRIAQQLLSRGHAVETLTNSPQRPSPLQGWVPAHPLAFDDPALLKRALRRTQVLYNTYWVRFDADDFSHARAVENSRRLFAAAKQAGVRRIVHVSITHADAASPYPYFRGKGQLEQALGASGVPASILRPAMLFGPDDILINNIAWLLRRFPVFGLFGRGDYRLQPIHADDMAALAVAEGARRGARAIQAIGPETFTYRALVQAVADALGLRRLLLPLPAVAGWAASQAFGLLLRDQVVTWDEMRALMDGSLYVDARAAGATRLSGWLREQAPSLGLRYQNELDRRRQRRLSYGLALQPAN